MGSRELRVGFWSGLDFWRAVRASGIAGGDETLEPVGTIIGARERTLGERADVALRYCNHEGKLDVVVSDMNERHNCETICDHVWSGHVGADQLYGIGDDTYFYKMPAVFVQLGMVMDVIELAEVACEMMGTYGLAPWTQEGRVQDIAPLVSRGELSEYVHAACAKGVRGATRALAALKIATPGSNSPRESDVAVFFKVSRRKGGAELGGFCMNEPIYVPEDLRDLAGQGTIKPDFCWQRQKVVVEYDSDEDHLSTFEKTRDERRRHALEAMGYTVLTLTNEMIHSDEALNAFVRELERRLGLRRKALTKQSYEERRNLRERLFGRERTCEALRRLNRVKS